MTYVERTEHWHPPDVPERNRCIVPTLNTTSICLKIYFLKYRFVRQVFVKMSKRLGKKQRWILKYPTKEKSEIQSSTDARTYSG